MPLPGAQSARDLDEDEPSKSLVKGYNHFALVVPLSWELAGIDNSLWLGFTPTGSTQTS
jgi:hypothetical protein